MRPPTSRMRSTAAAALAAAAVALCAPGAWADPDEPLPLGREPRWDRAIGDPDGGPGASPVLREGASDTELASDDERLAEAVREALRPEPALRWLTVRARDGVVVLDGEVDSAAQRTAAAVAAGGVAGVRELRNRIQVRPAPGGEAGEAVEDPSAGEVSAP